jgi:amino acid adenylation domain-containing protein
MSYTECCIHELIEQQVERTPGALALICGERRLTYTDLNQRANAGAHDLQSRGVGPESVVGICSESSVEAVIGVLAILKAGGAYVAVAARDPKARLRETLKGAGVQIVLATDELKQRIPKSIAVVNMDKAGVRVDEGERTNVRSGVRPEHMAFVRYTSGSTGQPKGVVNTHRSITSRLASAPLPDIQAADVCAVNTSMAFGSRLFYPLACGATVAVLGDDQFRDPISLVRAIRDYGVTSIYMVPSLLRQVLNLRSKVVNELDSLRAVTVGGDTLTRDLIQSFGEILPSTQLIQLYGSGEIGTTATLRVVSDDPRGDWRSIGRAVVNTRVYVLDGKMNEVPAGTPGEICVSSPHLARGYIHQPALTADRFVPNPFDAAGGRLYRTGDIGLYLPNGEIGFLGRADRQVKIRGFRVELDEIESVLQEHDQIAEAVVVCHVVRDERRVTAYIVSKEGTTPTISALRKYLRLRLPDYMIPTGFVAMEHLPLTTTGKLDRKALPLPEVPLLARNTSHEPARNSVETAIVEIWADILGVESVGIHDDFFELGGDSILATQIISRIWDRFEIELPLTSLLERPTIAEISQEIFCDKTNKTVPQDVE